MTRNPAALILSVCAFLVAGCETHENFSNANPQLVAAPDSVSAMLAEAANRASTALETLAAVEHSRSPEVAMAPVGDAPIELRRAVTVNWVGPVEPVTKTLADRVGYNFLTVGTAPPVPVVISLDAQNKPVIEILRDIGLQLGMRGDVKVDSSRRVVEVHYAPTTGVGR